MALKNETPARRKLGCPVCAARVVSDRKGPETVTRPCNCAERYMQHFAVMPAGETLGLPLRYRPDHPKALA